MGDRGAERESQRHSRGLREPGAGATETAQWSRRGGCQPAYGRVAAGPRAEGTRLQSVRWWATGASVSDRNIGEQESGPLPLTDVAFAHGCSQAHPPETPAGAPRRTVPPPRMQGSRLVHESCAVGDVDQGRPTTAQQSRPANWPHLQMGDSRRVRTIGNNASVARLSVGSRLLHGWGC